MIELAFMKELILIKQNKTNVSKECNVWHYLYFLNFSFKIQPNACIKCHDLLMMSINLSNIAVLKLKVLIIVVLLV